MDVIKTKLQTQNEKSNCEKLSNKRFNIPTTTNNTKFKEPSAKIQNVSYNYSKNEVLECNTKTKETKVKYTNVLSTTKLIYMESGLKGFFKGVMPRVFASAPSCAISWGTYETIKYMLSKKQK